MKTRNIIISFVVLFFTVVTKVMAENITVQTAQQVARSFLNSKMDDHPEIHLIDFAEKAEYPNFYVFGNEQCFVIIAVDNCVHPILGYSTENAFRTGTMPENIAGWLKVYNEDIALAVNSRAAATDDIKTEWENLLNGQGLTPKSRTSVGPLVRTRWNQIAPYNNLCPEDPSNDSTWYNGRVPTGCMATAMAQVMNYWEHPVRGVGSHSYTPSDHPEYGVQYANFGATVYDWDNMKNDYSTGYTDAEANAVATLMYHCGVSVNMNYRPGGSGGSYDTACMAFKTYFNYNPDMHIEQKSYVTWSGNEILYYTDEEWITMLKMELNQLRPLCYMGGYYINPDEMGAHAFVCDGYDENDLFHFNWGWGGSCDGYYAIGSLNTGSGSNQQWNQWNKYFCNCFPSAPSINPPSNVVTTVNGRNVNIQWSNVSNASSYKLYRDGDLIASNLTSTNYTDNNLLYGTYSYYVKSVKADGTMSLRSEISVAEVRYPGPVPTNLQASVNNHNVSLSWTAPVSGNGVLHYGVGACNSHCGYGDRDTYWAQRYPSQLLSDSAAGMAINKISVYRSSYYSQNSISITVYIYKGNAYGPEELLYQQNTTLDNSGWQDINLTTHVTIDYTNDLWIVMRADSTEQSPAAYCDYTGPGSDDALYLSSDGGVTFWKWNHDWSWMIKVYATDGTYTYNLYRNGDAIANNLPGNTYTDCNLQDGFYDYYATTNYYGSESDPSNTVHVMVGNPTYTVSVSANPNNGGTVTGNGTYNYNQTCTVTAVANTGYTFVNWTENGNVVSTNANYTFNVTSNRNLVAHFQLQSFTVTVSADPSDGGTVTGGGTYNYNQSCTMTATASTGYTFVNWTENGNVVSTNANYTFNVTGNRNLVAHFQLQSFTITISADPNIGGTVTGDGIYNYNQSCTVTATANNGFTFVNWTENGNPVSNQATYTFIVTSDRNLVANFTMQNYVITAIADPIGSGIITGAGGYNYGESCTLTATANTGYTFQRWTKNGTQVSTNPNYTFTVTESATYIAHFEAQTHTIFVSANPVEGGTVSGGGTFTYGQTCTVYASANPCYTFVKWTENGNTVSSSPDYSFTVIGNRSLVANFTINTYTITAETNPTGGGFITGTGSYQCGETCTLNVTPNENYTFLNWTENGNILSTNPTIQITVIGTHYFVANLEYCDGIEENSTPIEIFPNPVRDILVIKGEGITRVTVFNLLGQVIENKEVKGREQIRVNVQDYETAVYMLHIQTGNGMVVKRFVKD